MKTYSENYETYFKNNAMTIHTYKNNRKNAKIGKSIHVNHLINNTDDRKISDDRIIDQFVGTLESIIHQSKEFKNHLELSVSMDIFKQEHYKNAT